MLNITASLRNMFKFTAPPTKSSAAATTITSPATYPKNSETGTIINITDFNFWYDEKKQALHNINFSIARGLITAVIGPSGCGKSTLLRGFNRMNEVMGGRNTRTMGRIQFLNCADIYAHNIDPVALRKQIGMVFQKSAPFSKSIFENVVYPLRCDGISDRNTLQAKCQEALEQASLWDEVKGRLTDPATNLSGGQQQRLSIASTIVRRPELLLMDEPCSALDPDSTTKIEDLMDGFRQAGMTIVIVTHNMEQARRVSDNTIFIEQGNVIEYGETAILFQKPKMPRTEDYITGKFG